MCLSEELETHPDVKWAAGFLEGEGCFSFTSKSPCVRAAQKQRWPVEQLHCLFGGKIYRYQLGGQHYLHWHIYGPAAIGVMMLVYPTMSPWRKQQIEATVAKWLAGPGRGRGKYRNGKRVILT